MPYQLIWYVFLLPVISFAVISLFIRPFVQHQNQVAGYITILSIAGSLALSIWVLITVLGEQNHAIAVPVMNWLVIENGVTIQIGILMDALTAIMVVVVTFVSLMVQIYSLGYMHKDPGFHRYYAWMSLFTASMLGLVLADNLLMMFVFWEMVGLSSYLLIGFWFQRPSAADAAKKAFIVTRLGDFGFLAAILILFANTGTFDIAQLRELAIAGTLGGAVLTWSAIGIFAGAAGKSAQFPLHTWLPDAMEGPTPVSALIHAATMVAAGVFLVARMLPLFEHSGAALLTVAIIGGFTAIFAASMGLVAYDIKRVLAYSTVSQLGYMMLGLATGGVAIGIFHLFNHAFFKALLFLGSGSVNHATGTFDMRKMGGLHKVMPWTFGLFVIASLSLAGIWPLAGFWSKDEVLASALEKQPLLFILAIVTVFMTAFYMFRIIFMTFGGESRAEVEHGHSELHGKPRESPAIMIVPMFLLGILAIISGWWNVSGNFNLFLGEAVETNTFLSGFFGVFSHPLPVVALIVALAGIFLAYAMYSRKWISAEKVGDMFKPLYTVFFNKYWFDVLYEKIIVKISLLGGLFSAFQSFDNRIVDGTVNATGDITVAGGKAIRQVQTGQLQIYALSIGLGLLAIIVCVFIFGK
jgi:NADH-quinone oxidoreductase subunit L